MAAGSAHANTVPVSGSDSNVILGGSLSIYVAAAEPMKVQFTLEPEIVHGSFDALSYEVDVRSADDDLMILNLAGTFEPADSRHGKQHNQEEFEFDFLIFQTPPARLVNPDLLGTLLGWVSFTFPESGSGKPSGLYFSEIVLGLAPEPTTFILVGVVLILLSLVGHKRRQH